MQLLPEMVRCLRRDENYDLRMDMALVGHPHTQSYIIINVQLYIILSCGVFSLIVYSPLPSFPLPPPSLLPQLLSRLAPLLGRPVLVKYFVPLFPSLGSDAMFHVRKVGRIVLFAKIGCFIIVYFVVVVCFVVQAFAMGCKELCPVLGEDITEQSIVSFFLFGEEKLYGIHR